MIRWFIIFLPFWIGLLMGCTGENHVSGGTDFPNTISGTLTDSLGNPVNQARVILYPSSESSFKNDTVFSDENGVFEFTDVDTGKYSIEMILDSSLISFVARLIKQDEKKDLGTVQLNSPAMLSGEVAVDPNLNVIIGLKETHYQVALAENGNYEFSFLPEGEFQLEVLYEDTAQSQIIVLKEEPLQLSSGSEVIIPIQVSQQYANDKIKGHVISSDSQIITGVSMYLMDSNQLVMDTVLSDSVGQYLFTNVDEGKYFVRGELDPLKITSTISIKKLREPLSLDPIILKSLDSITGYIEADSSMNILIQLNETKHKSQLNNNGSFKLDSVPEGPYNLQIIDLNNDSQLIKEINIELKPGGLELSTIFTPYSKRWAYSKRIGFNTGPSGTNSSQNVYNFPVLIRLDSTQIDFSFFDNPGKDLRFVKANDSVLSHHVELWDSNNKNAVVWVLMDTLMAQDTNQFIHMYWNNSLATNISDPYSVFANSNGFQGVWHLSEAAADSGSSDVYKNSARDLYHGDDYVVKTSKQGVIGKGQAFGVDDFIRMDTGSHMMTQQITLSAWVKVDSTDSLLGTIASMKISYGMRMDKRGNFLAFVNNQGSFKNSTSAVGSLKDGNWHYMVETYDGNRISNFVDGIKVAENINADGIDYNAAYPNNTPPVRQYFLIGYAGAQSPPYLFDGHIDEVRMSDIPRSENWIKLCYENQKPDQNLIRVK